MSTLSNTRYTYAPLVAACNGIIEGLINHQESIHIQHSNLDQFRLKFAALCGTEEAEGSESRYNQAAANERLSALVLKQARRDAVRIARAAINVLKGEFGNSINPNWSTVGLTRSIQVPREPGPVLLLMEAYLRAHPTLEFAAHDVTAARIHDVVASLETARSQRNEAANLVVAAKAQRDQDRDALYFAAIGFRKELEILLPANDPRWYAFGFRRPVDGRIPSPVTRLATAPITPDTVLVSWAASTRATQYRVAWHRLATPSELVESLLTAELAATIQGLPGNVPVVIKVSALNKSGETQPAEITIGQNTVGA